MPRVFISHAHEDGAAADAIRRGLLAKGCQPEDVALEQADASLIRGAWTVVLYASRHSLADRDRLTKVRLAACYASPVFVALAPDLSPDDQRLADIDATLISRGDYGALESAVAHSIVGTDDRQPRVFLSYSRRDADRVGQLVLALRARRLRVFQDVASLQPGEDWLTRLFTYIEEADAMVLAMSPAAISSRVCTEEVAHAESVGTRLLPVRIAPLTTEDLHLAPPGLLKRNQVLADHDDRWVSAVAEIEAWVTQDAAWYRARADLLRAARVWVSSGRAGDRALRGAVLLAAKQTLAERPPEAPDFPSLVQEFLTASADQEVAEQDRLLRGVANGFAARAQQALAEGRFTHAAKCVGAAAVLAQDPLFTVRRAGAVWTLAARALPRAAHAVLIGHTARVVSARFSPDDTLVVTASGDASCRIWEVQTGRDCTQLEGHGGRVNFADFSPDGQVVASASEDGTARLWRVADGSCVKTFTHSAPVNRAVFSPDGLVLITTSDDRKARAWDVTSGKCLRIFSGHRADVIDVAFSPDGAHVATTSQDGTVRVWTVHSRGAVVARCRSRDMKTGTAALTSAQFSPDGLRVLSGSATGEVFIWSVATGEQQLAVLAHEDSVFHARFAPDGRHFATSGFLDRVGKVFDSATGALTANLVGHRQGVWTIHFSLESERVLTSSQDATARVWDARTGRELWRSDEHGDSLNDAIFSHRGTRIVTCSQDGTARIWGGYNGPTTALEVTDGAIVDALVAERCMFAVTGTDRRVRVFDAVTRAERVTVSPRSEWPKLVLFSPQGDRVAVGARGELRIVDLQGQLRERQATVERPWTKNAAFSRDGTRLAIADHRGAVSVLDGETATELARIEQSDGPITTIAFSPDTRLVATGTDRGEMALWSAVDGRLLLGLVPHGREVTTLQFSPDGARIASASWDSTVKIHHVATGTLEQDLQATSSGPVDNALFLPDSRRVLTQSRRAFVCMWDVVTGEALTRFDLRGSGLFNMAISPNGRFLAVATWEGQVQLWNLDTGVELADAQGEWTSVSKVAFSDSSDHLVVVADAKKLFVWGLSVELQGLGHADEVERAVVTAAALSNGVGVLLDHERQDFLFRDAPRDLYASLCAMLTDEQRAKIEPMARLLRGERPPDAYRPPFHARLS